MMLGRWTFKQARISRHLRSYAQFTAAPTMQPYQVFDREVKRKQRDGAGKNAEASKLVEYLREEVSERMMDRLLDIKRTYNSILDIGAGAGHFSKLLDPELTKKVVMLDSSEKMLYRDSDAEFEVPVERIQADEENLLASIERNSQEAIVSCLNLHWINDLPGALVQIREALKPDGFFLGAMLGGETLFELRTALQIAEVEREGGISPHISPMTSTADMTNLLGRAGLTLLTVDLDEVTIHYPSAFELMEDLQSMGEGNAIIGRRTFLHRDTLMAAAASYQALHGREDGSIPATFQIVFMIGWKPDPSQPKPLKRGSGQATRWFLRDDKGWSARTGDAGPNALC